MNAAPLDPEEMAYADVCDEMNDGSPGDAELGDLDTRTVRRAEKFAARHGFNWPPSVGDFDRYCEWRGVNR